MQIQWFGQSAFRLAADSATVVRADLVLVTHEHADHNGVGAIEGDPAVLRSAVGRFESPIGEVVGLASDHGTVAPRSAARPSTPSRRRRSSSG